MSDGLKAQHRAAIIAALAANDRVERAVLFGSRAMGTNTITSDVDIALFGDRLTLTDQAHLATTCDDLPMAQSVDLVLHNTIDNPALVDHIRTHGVEWYRQGCEVTAAKPVLQPSLNEDNTSLYHPSFPNHWIYESLYSMAHWVNGLAFKNIRFTPSGKPVIKISEIKNGISGQTKFTQSEFDESVRVYSGDLLFAWSGQPETSIDAFWWQGPEGWLNQHIFRVTSCDKIDQTFFFYLLRYLRPNFIAIARNKQTTGLGHVTKQDLQRIVAASPSLPEQKAIAHILGTLDDKIELNRRMNETLEAMAQALFKDWFVDFGPVRAKVEGREAYLPEEIWGLFPDSFQESELGEIPRGWGVKRLGEVVTQHRSGVKPGQIDPNTPYIALEHMPKYCIALSEWGNANELASSKFRFQQGDILFGKLRPYFHKVGVAPLSGICSTDIVVVSPKSGDWFGFTLGYLSSSDFIDYTDATSTGTRMPRTNWQNMASYKVPLPDYEIARSYTELVQPLVNKIVSNIHRSHTLAAQRDALLPRLVSGKLRVSKIDIYSEKMY